MFTVKINPHKHTPLFAFLLFALRFTACTETSSPSGDAAGSGGQGEATCTVASDCPQKQNSCQPGGASPSALNFGEIACVQGRCQYESTQEQCSGALPQCRVCPSPGGRAVCYAQPENGKTDDSVCAPGTGGAGQAGNTLETGMLTFGTCINPGDCKAPLGACDTTISPIGIAINYEEPTCVEGHCKVAFSRQPCLEEQYEACGIACVDGGSPKAYCYFTSTAGGGFLGHNECSPGGQGGAGQGGTDQGGTGQGGAEGL